MALPIELQNSLLPTELEFIASDELIGIKPLVRMDQIQFISGLYGPFVGGRNANVPIWVAVNLKLKKKCNIVPPTWLTVEYLQKKLIDETGEKEKDEFSQFPFHFVEMAKVLLDVASDDLQQPEKLRKLLKDIREARQSKIRDRLLQLNPTAVPISGVSAVELNEVRPFFARAMGTLVHLKAENATTMPHGQEFAEEYA